MKIKIFSGSLLIIAGVMIGWYSVVNWQLHKEIKKTEAAQAEQEKVIGQLEEYLQKQFLPAETKQE